MQSPSESSADSDQDFDPTAEMMVEDFDDEESMAAEEAAESPKCAADELNDLQREGEMPLDELLQMYGLGGGRPPPPPSPSSSEEEEEESAGPFLRSSAQSSDSEGGGAVRRRSSQVGPQHQADVPDGVRAYDDVPPYENPDELLWSPDALRDEEAVLEYLRLCRMQTIAVDSAGVGRPAGWQGADDEAALRLLLRCGGCAEEALRRRRLQPPSWRAAVWSEEECRHFEAGLRIYGKDFGAIRRNRVRTRTLGELVHFYYLWKKTERHDVFASKARVEKKRFALNPAVTDYMDRFIDEQESSGEAPTAPSPKPDAAPVE